MFFLQTFFQRGVNPTRKAQPKVEEFVCRNERRRRDPLKVKKKVHFECKPLDRSCGMGNEELAADDASRSVGGNGTQVKILMRKEEAARLLLKCRDGGILELKDVEGEFVRIRSDIAVPSGGV